MEYTFELKGVREFEAALASGEAVLDVADFEAMTRSVFLVEGEAKALVPRRTGRLFSSIHGDVSDGGKEGRVGTSVDYARFVEFGTAPHEILPVNKEALFWPGAQHPVARVHHPGTRADPYLGPALERSKDAIVAFFRDAAQKLVEHLAGR